MESNKKHLMYESVEEWMEKENVPQDFFQIKDDQLKGKYIEAYGELRQHLFDKHVDSLSKNDQKLFKRGKHPSQSHRFEKRAKPYAKALEKQLSGLDFVEKVSIGYYQLDRIALSIEVNRELSKEECQMIPWLYNGFETKVGLVHK